MFDLYAPGGRLFCGDYHPYSKDVNIVGHVKAMIQATREQMISFRWVRLMGCAAAKK